MDDIRINDDPRKQSARNLKNKVVEKEKRGFGGFLVDWFMKSLLMTIVLAIDFTLFVNAGNYKIFTDFGSVNMEAMFVYAGIAAISLVTVLLFMIILPLEDLLLSAVFAVTCVAVINQFAIFDKQSGLIVLVGEWFSNDINALLYQYFYWIVAAGIFLISFILLKILRRTGIFYLVLLLGGLCGWLISEAYLNPSKMLFKQVIAGTSKPETNVGKNLVFLAFNNLTSINNIKNKSSDEKLPIADKTWQNALAFLTRNGFVIYPNAVVDRLTKPFQNLNDFYNLGDKKAHGASMVTQNGYFDFNLLHPETTYLDKSSLFSALKQQGYEINAYQINGTNICRLENGGMVNSCYEKVNYPIILPNDKVSMTDRLVILISQWIVSTGLIKDINPVLDIIRYAYADIKPYDFKVNEVNPINSFNVLDIIISDMKYKGGNQAYFAIIDFPSDTFMYDEYCALKPVRKWLNGSSKMLPQAKRQAYLEQTSCLYGQLNKFMEQLKDNEIGSNTSVVLVGLSNPSFMGKAGDKDFYHTIQTSQQVGLAIKPLKSNGYKFDYRLCYAGDLLNMHFLNKQKCNEFGFLKTTQKNLENIKKAIKAEMISDNTILSANKSFSDWFAKWADINNYDSTKSVKTKNNPNTEQTQSKTNEDEIEKEPDDTSNVNIDNVVPIEVEEDASYDNQYEKIEDTQISEEAAEVIPSTLFDNGVNIEDKAGNSDAENESSEIIEEINVDDVPVVEIKKDETVEIEVPTIIEQPIQEVIVDTKPDNPKMGYDLKQTIEDAKAKAQQNIEQAQTEAVKAVEENKQKLAAKNEEIKKKTASQNEAIKSILVAPDTKGKKLSPEELKEQYHEMLRQAKIMSGNTISIEIVE